MNSNKLKGTLCVNPERGRHRHIPQIEWKCPQKLTLDSNWRVAAGEESTEAVTQGHVHTDPRLYAALREASDHSDSSTPFIPVIPIEEEVNLQLNNSPAEFLTTFAMGSETMSLAIDAVNALNAVALRQGEPPISMGLFMQWLNSDYVRNFISLQSSPESDPASMLIEPTQSVSFVSRNPDQSNCVRANTGMVIPKTDAWTSSMPSHDVIDMDLLARLLQNPGDIERLIREHDASVRSVGNQSASASIIIKPEADRLFFPRANTFPAHNSPYITGASSVPQEMFTSVVTASNNMSSTNNYIPLPETTMTPMSPLYSSPTANWESDMKTERIISDYGTIAGMRNEPNPWNSLISPEVSYSLPQKELSELPRASLQPTTNVLTSLLHRNPSVPEMRLHSVTGVAAPVPVPRTNLVTSMGPGSFLMADLVMLPKANQQPAANMIHLPSAFCPSPLINSLLLHGNPQIVGQGPSTLKPQQKPCMYFNSPRGCRNGTSCRYLHSKSDQSSPSQVEALPNAKRLKLGSDTSGLLYKSKYLQ